MKLDILRNIIIDTVDYKLDNKLRHLTHIPNYKCVDASFILPFNSVVWYEPLYRSEK